MLRLNADWHGEGMAGEVADQMLHNPLRPANALQRRTDGERIDTFAPVVRQAITLIERNISEPLTAPEIAAALGASQRWTFLIPTKLLVRDIAASGFNTLSHFADAFGKCFGRRPGWPCTLAAFLETLQQRRTNLGGSP